MKITIEIDCKPQEAREFFGLPDVAPVQEAFVAALGERLSETIASMDGEALFKSWMPDSMPGMDQWREMWSGGAKPSK